MRPARRRSWWEGISASAGVWRRVLPKSWDMRMGSLWGREGGRGKEEGLSMGAMEQWSNGAMGHRLTEGCLVVLGRMYPVFGCFFVRSRQRGISDRVWREVFGCFPASP